MGMFYFSYQDKKNTTKDIVYELSSTTDIKVTENASVTKYPVEDGSSVVDNYNLSNRTVSFSGVITDIKVYGQEEDRRRDVSTWIQEVRALRAGKNLVIVSVASLESIPNCIITNFSLEKGRDQGLSGWLCELEFKEVTVSERAKLVEVPVPSKDTENTVSKKVSNGDSSTKDGRTALQLSSLNKFYDTVSSLGSVDVEVIE